MADDFDDELYNVYNTVKEDSLGNTDIYGDDYKDALTGEEPEKQHQSQHPEQQQNDNVNPPPQEAKASSSTAANHEAYDPTGTTNDATHQGNLDDASKQTTQAHQQAYMNYSPQRQQGQQQQPVQQPGQQQPMMWGTFPPNMYQQYAAYQRTLQQMANPYQMQMFQQQFRQQQLQRPPSSMAQQQQQQPQTDEEGNRKPPSVASAANQDEGKMFIGGLNWETTDESLRTYFSQFGEVGDCVVMRDPTTGRSRGFGFLTMADHNTLDVIVDQDHYLDGKRIDPKRAIPREEQDKTEKIFVGGISADVDEEEFHDYFTQFGKVIDATLMTDRDSGRPRGFGFITFEDSNGVDEALRHPDLAIKGKPIEVKKAMPKSKQSRQGGFRSGNPGGSGGNAGYIPNTRYAGAANYNTNGSGRGGGGYGGFGAAAASMYPNMYGYGNYGMAAAAYYGGGAGGGRGASNANGYNMGGNNYYGGGAGRGNNYGDDAGGDYRDDEHHDDQDRRDDRRKDRSGGGALHASQARNQHHYRPY